MLQIKTTSISTFKLSDKLMNLHSQLSPIWEILTVSNDICKLYFLIRPLMPLVPSLTGKSWSIVLTIIGIGLSWCL
jgi:hypothetical protein